MAWNKTLLNSYFTGDEGVSQNQILDKKWLEYLNVNCDCGSPRVVVGGLQYITCSNPYCPIVLGERLAYMLNNKLAIKGIGPSTATKYFEMTRAKTVISFWDNIYDNVTMITKGQASKKIIENMKSYKSKLITYEKWVDLVSIPGLPSELFQGINSYSELVDEMSKFTTREEWILNKLKMTASDRLERISEIMYNYAIEFENISNVIEATSDSKNVIHAKAIISSTLNNYTPEEFIEKINVVSGGKLILQASMSRREVSFAIIDDYDRMTSPTAKYKLAREIEEISGTRVLYSAQEFIELIKGLTG